MNSAIIGTDASLNISKLNNAQNFVAYHNAPYRTVYYCPVLYTGKLPYPIECFLIILVMTILHLKFIVFNAHTASCLTFEEK